MPDPSVHQAYFEAFQTACVSTSKRPEENSAAECLYLIVTILGGEDARKQFQDDEIGDTDENGLSEFLDGWGHPIRFLRWAPGFNLSDIQPNINQLTEAADVQNAVTNDHDPFDSRRIDASAWRLIPLIYSAGPDYEIVGGVPKGYGLTFGPAGGYTWNNNTYVYKTPDTTARIGQTMSGGGYEDNIHNHHIE
jgi:hypothetical protein